MDCDEMARRLTELMEGELGADEEGLALEHLATCSRCESVLAETWAVVGLVGEYGRLDLPSATRARLWETVVDGVRSGGSA